MAAKAMLVVIIRRKRVRSLGRMSMQYRRRIRAIKVMMVQENVREPIREATYRIISDED